MFSANILRNQLFGDGVLALTLSCGLLTLGSACNVGALPNPWMQGPNEATARRGVDRNSTQSVDLETVDVQEVDLVEAVISRRDNYISSLRRLQAFYAANGHAVKDSWAVFELKGLKRVKKFRYLMDSEVPTGALRGTESIAAADELFKNARSVMSRAGGDIPGVYRQDLMIEAAQMLRDLIEKHPTSDKIDDAAFFCGEIHKEYLKGQELIAVKWYERAWTWNPETPHPARFQAAVVNDYRLHDRDRALELYHAVVNDETYITSNVRFAMRRIHELTADTYSSAHAVSN